MAASDRVSEAQSYSGDSTITSWQTLPLNRPEQAWFIGRQNKKSIRARVMLIHDKAESTIRGMVNVVGILERFLQTRHRDFRRVEVIPPVELDRYLTSFFHELKKPDGREYDPYSLSNLRSYLDRFLREHNYPCSIGVSSVFTASQHAFTRKRRSLLAMRYTQKELEAQSELRGLSTSISARDIELEVERLLYPKSELVATSVENPSSGIQPVSSHPDGCYQHSSPGSANVRDSYVPDFSKNETVADRTDTNSDTSSTTNSTQANEAETSSSKGPDSSTADKVSSCETASTKEDL